MQRVEGGYHHPNRRLKDVFDAVAMALSEVKVERRGRSRGTVVHAKARRTPTPRGRGAQVFPGSEYPRRKRGEPEMGRGARGQCYETAHPSAPRDRP